MAGARFLKAAAVAWVVGYAGHTADHLRIGIGATPLLVLIAGGITWVVGGWWVWRILDDDPRGPLYAIVLGVGMTTGFLAVHIPPPWGIYSESYLRRGTALQWIALALAVWPSVLLAIVGASALRRGSPGAAADASVAKPS